MRMGGQSRHLQWEHFGSRITEGPPSVEPLEGTPSAMFFIEPNGARIGLRVIAPVESLPLNPLAEILVQAVGDGPKTAIEISTASADLYRDFYLMGCTIADRVQIDHQAVDFAIAETLKAWTSLLRRKRLI